MNSKRIFSVFLVLALLFSLVFPTMAAGSSSKTKIITDTIEQAKAKIKKVDSKISVLEAEIAVISEKNKELSKDVDVVMGNIISESPNFIVKGSGLVDLLLNNSQYYLIQDPQNGTTTGYFYSGTHKNLGTQTVSFGSSNITVNVMGSIPENWRKTGDTLRSKKVELQDLYKQKNDWEEYIVDTQNGLTTLYYNGRKYVGKFTDTSNGPTGDGRFILDAGNSYLGEAYYGDTYHGGIVNGKANGYGHLTDEGIVDDSGNLKPFCQAVYKDGKPIAIADYSEDDSTDIILQIGNPYMYAYGEEVMIEENNEKVVPVSVNGSALIPIEKLIEVTGGSTEWVSAEKKVIISLYNKTIELTAGSNTALVNGKLVQLDVPAQNINGKIMVPVKFVSETLGMTVKWINDVQIIRIIYSKNWTDHIDDHLTVLDDGNIRFRDNTFGYTFEYPASWGKPKIENNKEYEYTASFHIESDCMYQAEIGDAYSATIFKNIGIMLRKDEVTIDSDPNQGFDVPVTSENIGVKLIHRNEYDIGGDAVVQFENGYNIYIMWSAYYSHYIDCTRPEIKAVQKELTSEIIELLKSITIYGGGVG